MTGYPIELSLAGRRAVVVGGGRVAARRIRSLLDADALVTVIAPEVLPEIAALGSTTGGVGIDRVSIDGVGIGRVSIQRRPYRDGDLDGAWLVHAATDDGEVNAAVAAAAEQRRVWCVRADAGQASTARMPAVTRHGEVTVAVTSGGDPRRSQRLRSAIAQALALGELPMRPRRRRRTLTCVRPAGHVALVGGGPGDPGLMTVLGRRLLGEADVVVADRLGPRDVLAELDPGVEIIEAGKAPGAHQLTQDQINELIVERALRGQRVVRLKGGDPFVFGRGGEEALACVRAGVCVQVVPGVTSAVAVPAYAGIPVTHRGITQDFAVVSAHLDPSRPGASIDWAALASGPGTLVLLMAMAHLEQISAELIKRGKGASTPVAVIQEGTTDRQQILRSTLKEVATDAARQGIGSPAVVVIGEVVRLSEELAVVSSLAHEAPGVRAEQGAA